MVVANAVAALSEINESSPTGMYRLLHYRQYLELGIQALPWVLIVTLTVYQSAWF